MDCPVCLEGDVTERPALCPNGHKFCEPCQARVQQTRHWRDDMAHCPLCRAAVPYIPGEGAPLHPVIPEEHVRHFLQWNITTRTPEHREAYAVFLQNRDGGRIPADSVFGGIHNRCCGDRNCLKRGGKDGVRFLLWNHTGTRRYRCDAHQFVLVGQ